MTGLWLSVCEAVAVVLIPVLVVCLLKAAFGLIANCALASSDELTDELMPRFGIPVYDESGLWVSIMKAVGL